MVEDAKNPTLMVKSGTELETKCFRINVKGVNIFHKIDT
jgi:hypothetical protein